MNMNELVTEAKIENMDSVFDFINERLEDCKPEIQNQIGIVIDEIFSNIVRYAYHPSSGNVTIRITVDSYITIEFEDRGVAFNPLSADEPDITLPAEEREIGGLGIFMVKKIMDSVEYRREGDKNILTVKKRRNDRA